MNLGNKNGYSYYYFYEYLPTRFEATAEQQRVRKLVYNFKDGAYGALYDLILAGMREIVSGDRTQWTICCIPASTAIKTQNRYAAIVPQLSNALGVNNGYGIVTVREDHDAGHLGTKPDSILPYLGFNNGGISGKKIILIDDVITRGRSFYEVANKLNSLGASKVIGFFIAHTINPDWHP